MRRSQSWLTMILFFTALLVIALFWTALSSMFLGFLYRNAEGLSTFRGVTQIATILTAALLFVTAILVAIPIAFQPGTQLQKILYVIPLFFLILTFVGVIANLVGIGTTGTLVDLGNGTILNFSSGWVAAGLILSTITLVIAAARTPLVHNVVLNATRLAAATGIVGVIAAAALVGSVVIVSTSTPTFGFPGGGPGGQTGPAAQGTQQAGQGNRQGGPGGPTAQGTQQAGQGNRQSGQAGPTARGTQQAGQGGEGGPGPSGPGGPGGGIAGITRPFTTGGVIAGILGVIVLISVIGGMRSLSSLVIDTTATQAALPDYQQGARSVLVGFVAIGVVVFLAIQLVPVKRDNPPITTTIQWDSPQTQQLFQRACSNCHSNETVWPWYSYVAPTSWLTTMHVNSARSFYNFSENSTNQLARFAQNAPMAIHAGEMPPSDFLFMHPEARLSDAEKQQLIDGLQKTFPRQGRQQGFNLNGF